MATLSLNTSASLTIGSRTGWQPILNFQLPLANFARGYFHQNWIDGITALGMPVTTDSVIAEMLEAEVREYVSDLCDELERLLAMKLNEGELKELLRERYNCGDDPYVDRSTWQYWVEHLRDRLDEHVKFSL